MFVVSSALQTLPKLTHVERLLTPVALVLAFVLLMGLSLQHAQGDPAAAELAFQSWSE